MGDPGRLPSGLGIPDPDEAVLRWRWRAAGRPGSSSAPPARPLREPEALALDGPELPPAAGVPDPDRPLVPEGRQALPVGPEGDGVDEPLVPGQLVPDPAIGEADHVGRDGRRSRWCSR